MLTRADWRSEWLITRRHPLLWAVIAGSTALVALAASNEAPRTDRELYESAVRLGLLVPAFILPFLAGAITPVFTLRDAEHGMDDLLAAYPQTPRDWLTVRLSSVAALLICLGAVQHLAIVGILAADHLGKFWDLLLRAGKLVALVYVPASLIWACVLARVSCAAGKASMVYLAAAFGWLAYLGLATLTDTPLIAGSFVAWEPLRTAMVLVDPYAITALVNPPPVESLPLSRYLAIGLGRAGWLVLCYLLVRGIKTLPASLAAQDSSVRSPGRIRRPLPWLPGLREAPGCFALLLRWTIVDKFFLLALAGWAVLVFPEVFGGMTYAEQLSQLTPDSRDALNRVMWDMAPPMGALLLLYAADRASRMSRMAGMDGLTAATAYSSWRLLAAQLACLWVVALILLVFTLLIVLSAQLAAQSSIQPGEYLQQAGQIVTGLLLTATAFVALHGIVRSRMAANLIGLVLVVLGHSSLAPAMGLLHPLWKPLSLPLEVPDHVLGLDRNWSALASFAVAWSAVCAAAMLFAVRAHHRGLPYAPVALRRVLLNPATVAIVLLLTGAAWQALAIQRMLESDFSLVSADERAQRRAAYERRYAAWLDRPQPQVAAVHAFVDFAADGGRADLRVTMQLVNRSAASIDRILVGRNLLDAPATVTIDRAAIEARDPATGQAVFRLIAPMRPGETRTLRFAARITRSPLASSRSLLILSSHFASLPAFQILPVIGYQREFSLRDPAQRVQFRLPPLAVVPPSQLGSLGPGSSLDRYQTTFETVISTPQRLHGVGPGELVRQWNEGGRSHFLFRTDRAIRNAPAFFALPWAARRWQVGSLAAEIRAPGPIGADNPSLLGMRDTLTWLNREMAPYPGRTLRLIAAPEFGSSGFALPQVMLISHRRSFRAHPAPDAGFDQAYRRAVHETAHQWFGHAIGYGVPEERAFLVESLAKYAELVMVERRYGSGAVRALVDWESDRLDRARLAPAMVTVPLLDAEDTEDMYSRATVAFACLRSRVGDAALVAALRETARSSQQTGSPVRSLDFVRALKRIAGKAGEPAIDRMLTSNLPIAVGRARSGCAGDRSPQAN